MDAIRKQLRQRLELEQMMGGEFLPRSGRRMPQQAAAATVPGMPVAPVAPSAHAAAGKDPVVEGLAELEASLKECCRCRLGKGRTNLVFGEGNPHAALVFVGEAPGADEDRLGRPFVGRAGGLLNDIITKGMGLKRENVYICNVCKCRPPENRTPAPDEMAECLPYLMRQLALIHPKAIVALGACAAQGLLSTTEGVGQLRGRVHSLGLGEGAEPIPVLVTYHPAYLLRNYSREARGKVWDDIQAAMKIAGIPIPKKKS